MLSGSLYSMSKAYFPSSGLLFLFLRRIRISEKDYSLSLFLPLPVVRPFFIADIVLSGMPRCAFDLFFFRKKESHSISFAISPLRDGCGPSSLMLKVPSKEIEVPLPLLPFSESVALPRRASFPLFYPKKLEPPALPLPFLRTIHSLSLKDAVF